MMANVVEDQPSDACSSSLLTSTSVASEDGDATADSVNNSDSAIHLEGSDAGGDSGSGTGTVSAKDADSSSLQKIYRSDYLVTQINGCRQYGPPKVWNKPIPGFGCEIYVKRIPPEFTEVQLVPLFERFGKLYEMRLMMDYNNQNRRYCFVRYTTEDEAKLAIEILNHYFVAENQTLEVQKSFEKCRLFVGNLPKELDRRTIEIAFRSLFPEMSRFVMHNRISDGERNRGFAFMDFPDHASALRAKKQTTPGCMRIWDRDIKIVWANPQRSLDHSGVDEVKTLFMRNIDGAVTYKDLYVLINRLVPRKDIIKISRVREFAFVELALREQAQLVMHAVQGYQLNGIPLDIEWAMPPLRNSFHNMKNYDFDALLRTKCIANGWDLPILLYGRVFSKSCLQYVAVILRAHGRVHVYFVEIWTVELADIQSRVCEAMVTLILENGSMPAKHLVVKIKNDFMLLVGSVSSLTNPKLELARGVDPTLELFWSEIVDLSTAAEQLIKYSFDGLYGLYSQALDTGSPFTYLDAVTLNDRKIGCLDQCYRRRPPLNAKLDNREIILVLCDLYTLTNYNFSKKNNYLAEALSAMKHIRGVGSVQFKCVNMLPARFVQPIAGRDPKLGAVYYGYNPYPSEESAPGPLAMWTGEPPKPERGTSFISNSQFNAGYGRANYNIPPPPPPMQVPPPPLYGMVPPELHYYNDANLLSQAMYAMGFNQQQQPPFGVMPQAAGFYDGQLAPPQYPAYYF